MKSVWVTIYTDQTPSLHSGQKICLSVTPLKNKKLDIHESSKKYEVHIFDMWTISMQSFNKNEWKLLELQITKTRRPKSIADEWTDGQTDSLTNGFLSVANKA